VNRKGGSISSKNLVLSARKVSDTQDTKRRRKVRERAVSSSDVGFERAFLKNQVSGERPRITSLSEGGKLCKKKGYSACPRKTSIIPAPNRHRGNCSSRKEDEGGENRERSSREVSDERGGEYGRVTSDSLD